LSEMNILERLDISNFLVHDQGSLETCTIHAITAAHELLTNRLYIAEDLFPDFINEDDGAKPSESLAILSKVGQRLLRDRDDPNAERYLMKYSCVERDMGALKKKLNNNLPIIVGVRDFNDTKGYVKLISAGATDRVEKHCIVLIGYNDDEKAEGGGYFLILNSHGTSWGQNGFGKASYGYIMNCFIDGFVLKTNAKRKR